MRMVYHSLSSTPLREITMFPWYSVYVRVVATTPVVHYRSGKQKGEVKSGGWAGTFLETPTFFLNADVQGIVDEAHAAQIAADIVAPEKYLKALEELGYTDVERFVHCVGLNFTP
jgi:hypothetical protein